MRNCHRCGKSLSDCNCPGGFLIWKTALVLILAALVGCAVSRSMPPDSCLRSHKVIGQCFCAQQTYASVQIIVQMDCHIAREAGFTVKP